MGRPRIYDRDKLLGITAQLFWRKGLADTSLADIEKATGVNKSSLYAEFSDKDDIFIASLSHFIEVSGVYETLSQLPLGKGNIVRFLKLGKSCSGQQGCFVVNSVRESAILPLKAKDLIQVHLKKVRLKLIDNIESSDFQGDASACADLILTFNAGLCLELNASKSSQDAKIDAFIKLLKI